MDTKDKNKKIPISFAALILTIYYGPMITFFTPSTNFGAGLPDFAFLEFAFIFLVLISFVDFAAGNLKNRVKTFWIFILGAYSFVVIISLLWSEESYNTTNIRDMFYHIFIPFLSAYVITFFIREEKCRQILIKHAAIGCVILSIIGLSHLFMNYGGNTNELRSAATLGNPNALAIFLVLHIPILLYGIQTKSGNRILLFMALLIIFLGIFSTISRKGIITASFSIILYFTLSKNFKLLFLCIFLIIPTGAFFTLNQKNIADRFEKKEMSTQFSGRWGMTLSGWEMFKDHPILGLGYKGYYNEFGNYFKGSGRKKYDAHNNFITALANFGAIGFLLFLGIFVWPLMKSFKNLKSSKKDNHHLQRLKFATGISMIIPFMFNAWFAGDLMYISIITCVLYVLIGMFCIPFQQASDTITIHK